MAAPKVRMTYADGTMLGDDCKARRALKKARKKPATRASRASSSGETRDAVIAEHMARTQLALCQQAEMFTAFIVALRSLTAKTAALSAQIAELKRRHRAESKPQRDHAKRVPRRRKR